ncbi:hypothetical protein JZ751_015524 [Albula glossodonta]|uniref:Uncharacterized protein n=1 Tax=Albula glossodonta TaxID=121402 RepID=A0A8T2MX23_9TELE|nr:hypothetical protein JZ751_015524 [Albula glossodonta]
MDTVKVSNEPPAPRRLLPPRRLQGFPSFPQSGLFLEGDLNHILASKLGPKFKDQKIKEEKSLKRGDTYVQNMLQALGRRAAARFQCDTQTQGESAGGKRRVKAQGESAGGKRRRKAQAQGESAGGKRRRKAQGESAGGKRRRKAQGESAGGKRRVKAQGESAGGKRRRKAQGESAGGKRRVKAQGESAGGKRRVKAQGESAGGKRRGKAQGESAGGKRRVKAQGESAGGKRRRKAQGESAGGKRTTSCSLLSRLQSHVLNFRAGWLSVCLDTGGISAHFLRHVSWMRRPHLVSFRLLSPKHKI